MKINNTSRTGMLIRKSFISLNPSIRYYTISVSKTFPYLKGHLAI